MKLRNHFYLLLLFVLFVPAMTANAQEKEYSFCQNNNYWGNKSYFSDLREIKVAKTNLLTVDGRKNGGISVKGENRSDILVRACVQTQGNSDSEARSVAQNIKIQTGSTIRAENSNEERNWSVSYQILVPHNTDLKLIAHNGGISINNVEGDLNFETLNGGLNVNNIAGNVMGRTQNGGINAQLSGKSWKGKGLNLETKNGGVKLTMPENYSARLETATVNGGFKSDMELTVKLREYRRGVNINTDINGGGAPIRVVTTNGGVSINSTK